MSYIAHLQRTLEEQEEVDTTESRGNEIGHKQGIRKVPGYSLTSAHMMTLSLQKCWPYSHPEAPSQGGHREEEQRQEEGGEHQGDWTAATPPAGRADNRNIFRTL